MNKEELIKISRENLRKSKQGSLCECYDEAFIKGYELSKNRIEELEKENAELSMKRKAERKIFQGIVEKKNDQLTKAKEKLELLGYEFEQGLSSCR